MNKISLCVMSMELIFILVFIKAIDFPVYFGSDWEFIGWKNMLGYLCELRNIIAILCVAGVIWSEMAYRLFRYQLKGTPNSIPDTLINVENKDVEYLSLLLTIITIVCSDFGNLRDIIIFVIVYILYWIITIHTELYATNPLLRFRGMHLYTATADKIGEGTMFLSYENIKPGQDVIRQYKKISKHVYVLYTPQVNKK